MDPLTYLIGRLRVNILRMEDELEDDRESLKHFEDQLAKRDVR